MLLTLSTSDAVLIVAVHSVAVLAAVGAVKLTFSVCETCSSRSKSARRTYSEFTVLILELFSVSVLINYFH